MVWKVIFFVRVEFLVNHSWLRSNVEELSVYMMPSIHVTYLEVAFLLVLPISTISPSED